MLRDASRGWWHHDHARKTPSWPFRVEYEKNGEGKIVARFKIVNSLTIALAILVGAISYGSFITDLPMRFAFVFPAVLYLYMSLRYYADFSGLMNDIRKIESNHTSQKLR